MRIRTHIFGNPIPPEGGIPNGRIPNGFSLLEVLLAIFILGIGMIMVASVFPVGANWTKQATEESVAQNVAQSALGVIETYYHGPLAQHMAPDYKSGTNLNTILQARGKINTLAPPMDVTPFTVQMFPGLNWIPVQQRAYQLGSNTPFPARDASKCVYFWTALARLNPAHWNYAPDPTIDPNNGITPSTSYKYDVFILVFRKGDVSHQFMASNDEVHAIIGNGAAVRFDRDVEQPFDNSVAFPETLIPSLYYATFKQGAYSGGTWTTPAMPFIGQYGIGARSGTVFKEVLSSSFDSAMPRPWLLGQTSTIPPQEHIIYAPAADGTAASASPLIYVYQTTLTF